MLKTRYEDGTHYVERPDGTLVGWIDEGRNGRWYAQRFSRAYGAIGPFEHWQQALDSGYFEGE